MNTEQPTLDTLLTDNTAEAILAAAETLFARLDGLPDDDTRIDVINQLRLALHQRSPLRRHPADCVLWVRSADVTANDYNPNEVAQPEMELLELSVTSDGFTQPIVAWSKTTGGNRVLEIVDGFHRHLVGKSDPVSATTHGRLPVTVINPDRTGEADRRAATVRHNRARGQHTVEGMSNLVIDLSREGKTDEWIGQHLGMQPDEVTRLRQVTGIAQVFLDEEFSEAWEADTPDPWKPQP